MELDSNMTTCLDLSTIQTEKELDTFIWNHPDIDVKANKDQIIECLAKTVLRDVYRAYGKADLLKGINAIIRLEGTVMQCSDGENHRKAQLKFDFYSKLQPLVPAASEADDFTMTPKVFFNMNQYNINVSNLNWYDKSIRGISLEQAVEFACQEGENLTKLNLSLCGGGKLSPELFKRLLDSCPNMKIFDLYSTRVLSNYGKGLSVGRESDDEAAIRLLLDAFKGLEEFSALGQCMRSVEYEKIAQLKNLRSLKLKMCFVDDEALEQFAKLENLEILGISAKASGGYGGSLYGGSVTDKGLEHLARYPKLKEVDLTHQGRLSQQALDNLKQARPDLKIVKWY